MRLLKASSTKIRIFLGSNSLCTTTLFLICVCCCVSNTMQSMFVFKPLFIIKMPQHFFKSRTCFQGYIVPISIDHNFYDANCQKKLTFSDRPPLWPLATLFVKTSMVANLEAIDHQKAKESVAKIQG